MYELLREAFIKSMRAWMEALICQRDPEDPCSADMDDEDVCEACKLAWDLENAITGL